jgi:hypothetical protein
LLPLFSIAGASATRAVLLLVKREAT